MVKLIQTIRSSLSTDYTLEYTDDREAAMFDPVSEVSFVYRDNATDKQYLVNIREINDED